MGNIYSEFTETPANDSFRAYAYALLSIAPWKVTLTLALMVCLSLTEGVGLLLLIPLLQLVGLDLQQGNIGRLAEFVSSTFTALDVRPTLVVVLGIYVIVISVRALLYYWQNILGIDLKEELVACLRKRLYRAIVNTSWLFFARSRSSDFTYALTTEVERIGTATYYLLNLLATAAVMIVYISFALRLSAAITGLVFLCGGGLMLLLRRKTQLGFVVGEEFTQAMNSMYAAIAEHLGGMKTAKSYGAEGRHAGLFTELTDRVRRVYVRAVRNQAEVKCLFDIGSVLILGLILYVSFEVLTISTAEVLLLLILFARAMPRFSGIQQSYQLFANEWPAFATMMGMQARCDAAAEPEVERSEKVELKHDVRLENVSFNYNGKGEAPAIRDLDLTIKAGEITAIVGPSGGGKSTIADLVMGLIAPDQGWVLVDGTPLNPERVRAWRDQIGYVAQDTFLFHDTIRANLLWACLDATDGEIDRALKLSAAEEFVSGLPQGLETVLGDRGIRLSGGERQRLALARALLRKPSLLILDEATSSLDSENEERIRSAMEKLRGHMTVLIITHRLSAVRNADVIHVLEQAYLVESGTWDMLIAKENGRFRSLCKAQGMNGNEYKSQDLIQI